MKQESRKPYELFLDDMIHCREVQDDDVVEKQEPCEVFDETAEQEKIRALQKKIAAENAKATPDTLSIARWQREIVQIRQYILSKTFKQIKVKGRY